ncbi:MAG: hypothetical protein KJ072_26410 [Verrucomicrobia bacterium]|nr:hypothetical protein [Verrucomicrobiota bacterium]
METPNDTGLNEAIRLWRAGLADAGTMRPADLDELEIHLRDSIGQLTRTGLASEEAFLVARRRLGTAGGLTAEFAKVNGHEIWLTRVLWMVGGVMVALLMEKLSSTAANLALFANASIQLEGQPLVWFVLGAQWFPAFAMAALCWMGIRSLPGRLLSRAGSAPRHPWLTTFGAALGLFLVTALSVGTQVLVFRGAGGIAELGTVMVCRSYAMLLAPLVVWPALLCWLLRRRARSVTRSF